MHTYIHTYTGGKKNTILYPFTESEAIMKITLQLCIRIRSTVSVLSIDKVQDRECMVKLCSSGRNKKYTLSPIQMNCFTA